MKVMGFYDKWIEWMMLCVKTTFYNFCLNDSYIGLIFPKRGLRQGDPMSPYLFLLCVEGLSDELQNAANVGDIRGCSVSQSAPIITHLLFADDSFLYFRGIVDKSARIQDLLIKYERCSRQLVNFQKSGIFFRANVRREKQLELSGVLGVYNDINHTKYLGLLFLIGRSKKSVFSYLKERAIRRIQEWQKKPISYAGKTVLIRNVVQAIPTYTMSCFLHPKTLSRIRIVV